MTDKINLLIFFDYRKNTMKKLTFIFLSILSLNAFAEELNVVDEYNQRQQALAQRKAMLSVENKKRIQRENIALQQTLQKLAEDDRKRAAAGIPSVWKENKPGGLDMTREKMNVLSGNKLPPTPPTGTIKNIKEYNPN